jgi:hypothetical protein
MKKTAGLFFVAVFLMIAASASAATYEVKAYDNSSTGGTGAATIDLTAGQAFTVSVDPNDLWSAGELPRWSNADGLIGDLFANGSDESGQTAGTKIGILWPSTWTQGNLEAPFGSLVGRIGDSGDFFLIGTNFSGNAAVTGKLNLFYWDMNYSDNTEKVAANVNAVPIPAAIWLFGTGILGFIATRRKITS